MNDPEPSPSNRSGFYSSLPARAASTVFNTLKSAASNVVETVRSSDLIQGENNLISRTHDPLEEKRHQEILREAKLSLNKPVGVLSIHIKSVEFIDLNPKGTFSRSDLTVYIRIHVGKQIKCTGAFEGVVAPTNAIFDSIKHFLVQISPKRSDSTNYVRIEFVAFDKDKPSRHYILASKEMHIYDIIKRLYAVDSIDMYKLDKPVGVIDIEFCFAYGTFGYGYSNQFENRQKTPLDHLNNSMFCREDPPPYRLDCFRNTMTPRPVGHPAFINFTSKMEIGDTVKDFKSEMSLHDWQTIEEPVLLISKMKHRMHKLQAEYNEQPNRKSRVAYLRNLVHGKIPPSDVNKGIIQIPSEFKLRTREFRRRLSTFKESDGDGGMLSTGESSADIEELQAMTEVIQQAPGIIARERVQQHLLRMQNKQEEGTNESRVGALSTPAESKSGFFKKLFQRKTTQVQPQTQMEQPTSTKTPETPPVPDEEDSFNASSPLNMRGNSQKFGKKLAHKSQLMQGRRSSISSELAWDARRVSFLESAAVRLRKLVTHEEEEPIEVPRLVITPATPDPESEDED